jgi:NADPH-dependent 2,4-dienoyl-CoA reductase/sulfur reductase-like enzyme/pSer/pThr/pTyr-binding forkhead associated (FHA) protein
MVTRSRRYVIVGDGAAGMTAARALRMADGQAQITLVSDDPNPAYFRAALTNYLLGELREEQIWATRPEFYEEYRLQRLHARCSGLDAARAKLALSYGAPLDFDALLIAAGARSREPSFAGAGLMGVMTLRTLQDTRMIMERIASGQVREAVVVGGGPLALEWALGMHAQGIQVHLVVRGNSFMASTLDAIASDLLAARLREAGIHLHLGEEIAGANPSQQGAVASVTTRSGKTLGCQLLAAAIGVVPNTEWLVSSGLRLSERRAIVVDERMQTSLPNVYAAGDIVDWPSTAQLWEPAQSQAKIAAANMVGQPSKYAPGVHYMATRLFDLDCASLGRVVGVQGAEELSELPRGTGRLNYRKLVIEDGKLVGALMLGHREDRVRRRGRWYKRLIDAQVDIDKIKNHLLDDGFDLASWFSQAVGRRPAPLAAPEATATTSALPSVRSGAELRGTQAISLTGLLHAEGGIRNNPSHAISNPAVSASAATRGLSALLAGDALPTNDGPNNAAAAHALGTQMLTQFNQRPEAAPTVAAEALPERSPAVLEWTDGRRELSGNLIRIGRAPGSDVQLLDPSVSLIHAHLQQSADKWYLRDLGSDGGTWINDAPLTVARGLQSGDRIRVGNSELLFFYVAEEQRARARTHASGPDAPRVEVRSGHAVGLSFELPHSGLVIGRDASRCGLCLDEASWVPEHARIARSTAGWQITRVSPQGAVWVNQQTCNVGQSLPLNEGQPIQIGRVQLVYTQTPIVGTSATVAQAASVVRAPAAEREPPSAASADRFSQATTSSGRRMQAFAAVSLQPAQLEQGGGASRAQAPAAPPATNEPYQPPTASAPPPDAQRETPISPYAAASVLPQHSQAPVSAYDATTAIPRRADAAAALEASSGFQRPPMMVVQLGPNQGQRVPVTGPLVIGNQPGCSWLIADPTLAARQAELTLEGTHISVRNLGPSGSLRVNGRDSGDQPRLLSPGDQVQLGTHTVLVYEGSAG